MSININDVMFINEECEDETQELGISVRYCDTADPSDDDEGEWLWLIIDVENSFESKFPVDEIRIIGLKNILLLRDYLNHVINLSDRGLTHSC